MRGQCGRYTSTRVQGKIDYLLQKHRAGCIKLRKSRRVEKKSRWRNADNSAHGFDNGIVNINVMGKLVSARSVPS